MERLSAKLIERLPKRLLIEQIDSEPSGFFARCELLWYHQDNSGYSPSLSGDDFFQENIFAGYRFPQQHGEISFGVLNLGDIDYHLNPLSTYSELPHGRVFVARLSLSF